MVEEVGNGKVMTLTYGQVNGATLKLYWGTSDGGTDESAWQNEVVLGNYFGLSSTGILSTGESVSNQIIPEAHLSGLVEGTTYFYRTNAVNSVGEAWALETKSFLATHPLDFDVVDGSLDFDEVDDSGLSVARFDALASGMSGQLTYELVSGNMDFHNSLFILEANGTLRNKYPFDYESNPLMYAIRYGWWMETVKHMRNILS